MVRPLIIAIGSPGRSEQTRKSMGGTPSSVRSTPKTSLTTPSSKRAGRCGTMTATVERGMAAVWQKICGCRHSCHWWQETQGSKLTAMTFFAVFVLLALIAGIGALLERNSRHHAGEPSAPYGADLDRDVDLWRLRHDLDVARPAC